MTLIAWCTQSRQAAESSASSRQLTTHSSPAPGAGRALPTTDDTLQISSMRWSRQPSATGHRRLLSTRCSPPTTRSTHAAGHRRYSCTRPQRATDDALHALLKAALSPLSLVLEWGGRELLGGETF
uniref:Uncharacterized protein n=1 Tax=Phytophthora ramorum TaxID=164328 RepID=H3H6K1_PHYRM